MPVIKIVKITSPAIKQQALEVITSVYLMEKIGLKLPQTKSRIILANPHNTPGFLPQLTISPPE
jgi:hypothetical protein